MGFILTPGSDLREPINAALAAMKADGTLDQHDHPVVLPLRQREAVIATTADERGTAGLDTDYRSDRPSPLRPKRRRGEFPLWLLVMALGGCRGRLADHGQCRLRGRDPRGLARHLDQRLGDGGVVCPRAACSASFIVLARTSRFYLLRQAAMFYIELIRGIPMLIFLFYVAFVGAPLAGRARSTS